MTLFDSREEVHKLSRPQEEQDLVDSFDDDLSVTRKHHLVGILMRIILRKEHQLIHIV